MVRAALEDESDGGDAENDSDEGEYGDMRRQRGDGIERIMPQVHSNDTDNESGERNRTHSAAASSGGGGSAVSSPGGDP